MRNNCSSHVGIKFNYQESKLPVFTWYITWMTFDTTSICGLVVVKTLIKLTLNSTVGLLGRLFDWTSLSCGRGKIAVVIVVGLKSCVYHLSYANCSLLLLYPIGIGNMKNDTFLSIWLNKLISHQLIPKPVHYWTQRRHTSAT